MADDIDEEHVAELAYKENCGFDSWVPMDKESFDSWPEMLQIREVAYRLKIEVPLTPNFVENQKEVFYNLATLFETYYKDPDAKLPDYVSLPSLPQFPKFFNYANLPNDYIVRKSVLHLFSQFYRWFEEKARNRHYGQYFMGPEGVGKSVAVYFCACLAYSLGWVVVYIANCEEWIASEESGQDAAHSKLNKVLYIFQALEKSLVNHYNQATNPWISPPIYGTTWGELIANGKLIAAKLKTEDEDSIFKFGSIVGSLLQEIHQHKDHPVLFIADEVSAIFDKGKQDTSLYGICTNIGGKSFANGYKLLSGTKHSKFLSSLGSGMWPCVHIFLPPTEEEFKLLFKTRACATILQKALEQLPFEVQTAAVDMFTQQFGRAPKLLKEFGDFLIEQNKSMTFEEINIELEKFKSLKIHAYQQANIGYFLKYQEDEKRRVYCGLVQMFEKTDAIIPSAYLDLSLVYHPTWGSLAPINPIAADALLSQLFSYYNDRLDPTHDMVTVLRDEISNRLSSCYR